MGGVDLWASQRFCIPPMEFDSPAFHCCMVAFQVATGLVPAAGCRRAVLSGKLKKSLPPVTIQLKGNSSIGQDNSLSMSRDGFDSRISRSNFQFALMVKW